MLDAVRPLLVCVRVGTSGWHAHHALGGGIEVLES
jgi:hypothetical protein